MTENQIRFAVVFYSPGLKRTTWLTVLGTNVSHVKQAILDNPWAQCEEMSKNLIDIFELGGLGYQEMLERVTNDYS